MAMMNWRALVAGAMMTAITTTADAATQGSLGATSTGTVGVSATIPARVQITGLSDLAFGTLDPSSAASSAENVCVWSNTATKGYNLTAAGDGGSNAFTLTNGTTTLAYAVEWAGTSGQTTGSALTTNTPKTGLTSTATASNCSSSTTASLIVKFSTAQMQAAVGSATAYTGTLTLLVAPE
jgi:hypothetical protein